MNEFCILQVEDNDDDVLLLHRAFVAAGIDNPIHVVRDGGQALDYFSGKGAYADRTKHPLPAIVLLDLNLPVVSGLTVLQWIGHQAELATLIKIVLTSSNDIEDIQNAYRLGAHSYIVKPANFVGLHELADALRDWWLQRNRFAEGPDFKAGVGGVQLPWRESASPALKAL